MLNIKVAFSSSSGPQKMPLKVHAFPTAVFFHISAKEFRSGPTDYTSLYHNQLNTAVHILTSTQKQHRRPPWEDISMRFSSNPHPSSAVPRSTSHAHKLLMFEKLCPYSVSSFLQPAILAMCPTPTQPAPAQSLCSQLLCWALSSCCTSIFWHFLLSPSQ